MLLVLSGRPGVGKTTIAREVAQVLGAVHVRIDSIEQTLRDAGVAVTGEGYAIAYAVAEDNLRVGRVVIADCVNPWPLTREAWRGVAERAGVRLLDVEIVCSDPAEHRHRVETRVTDIARHRLPTWQEVVDHDYRAWDRPHLVVDTAGRTVQDMVRTIVAAVT